MAIKHDKQEKNKPMRNEKGQILPGFSGNLNGRPRGKTLKEYQAEKFREMTDEQREEFLKDIAKELQWRMAEGNPQSNAELDVKGNITITFDNQFNAETS